MVTLHEYSSLSNFDSTRQDALASLLYSDEEFIYGIDVYDAMFMTKKRASKLVLTDRRVIEFKRGFIKESSKDFSLEDIASIEYDKGYVMRKITIEGQGISKDFQSLEDYGKTFVTAVREQMQRNADDREPIEAPTVESGSTAGDVASTSGGSIPSKFGSIKIHILIFILTFWTFGFMNLVYAGYGYYTFKNATSAE